MEEGLSLTPPIPPTPSSPTDVINCAGRQLPNLYELHGIRYLTYPWLDTTDFQIFDANGVVVMQIVSFIDEVSGVVGGGRGTGERISPFWGGTLRSTAFAKHPPATPDLFPSPPSPQYPPGPQCRRGRPLPFPERGVAV